jgi:uncharacterized caspase-like protein
MQRFLWVALALICFTLAGAARAQAEKRIALLIGNEAYASEIGRLANPHNDIALLEQALKRVGFDVTVERDAGLGALTRAVNAYARRLQSAGPGAVGFFYYSGHGASDGSTNYLIPIDVKTIETGELWDQSLQLTEITRKLKRDASNATHFVVFDACRNTLKLTHPGSRAIVQSKGFVPVAQENGMLVAYATAEGELASDVGAGAGPYAKVLAEEIVKPGIEAVVMFRAVQRRVRAGIGQEPYLGFSALGDVYFAGKDAQAPEPVPTQARLSEVAEAWDRTKDTKNIALLEAFIARYKDTFFAQLARARIDELKRPPPVINTPEQVAIARPPALPTKDDPELTRLKLSADQGNADAQLRLGLFYEFGRGGLTKNDREAARLYKLSADQGNAYAQGNLGFFYESGRGGLTKDDREAARLYKLAADQGNDFAIKALQRLGSGH